MRFHLQFLATFAMIGFSMNAYAEDNYVSRLTRLRELAQQKSITTQELVEAQTILAEVRAAAPKGQRDVTDALLSIVESGQNHIIGPLAVPAACEKADAQGADKLVVFIQGLVAEIQKRPSTNKDRSTMDATALVGAFLRDGAKSIAAVTTQPRRLLDIIIAATTAPAPMLPPDVRQKALLLIAESAITPAIRKEYAIRFISLRPNESAPDGFADLFAREDFPRLRQLIRDPNTTAETFSYGAADILAHHGDEVVLPDLRAFLAKHAAGRPTPEGMIQWNIWQIENQHPATKLLDYIRGTDMRAGEQGRVWAMRRALAVNIDKKSLREAILAHAEAMKSSGNKFSLCSLKQSAIDCGVLNVNDLPDVAIAKGIPTP